MDFLTHELLPDALKYTPSADTEAEKRFLVTHKDTMLEISKIYKHKTSKLEKQ